ncbi:anti-sigma factor [Achromobacter spanius]|uniref:anti-sigma factor n=1 Tax=Achromobacter TaxID=222 RepID=UPI001E3CAE44|nr:MULTISPECIES: anti-sigma factor [Achromobacter]MCD0498004.1 anti-sigma factor [Achromobacter sp. MY14]MCW3156237.1 anti-sigma factor [Achromobacter spanius]
MNYRHPELQDRLAAEYVLGGLRAGARQRFITLMRDDAGLRRAVTEWEDRLLPLALALPPETPPAHVWKAIAARIAPAAPAARAPSSSRGLSWWRAVSAGLATAVVVLAFLMLKPAPTPVEVRTVAVLSGDKAPGAMVVNTLPDNRLAVQPMQDLVALADGRALELWSITPGQAPRSLGLVLPGQTTVLAPSLLPQQGDTVAITLEPAGGAPGGIPTGPVVLSGKVI